MSKNALYSVPDCHDGEAQEKPKSAPKLGQQGREGVEEDLLFDLGELGHRPEAVLDLTVNGPGLVRFEVNVEELVLVVVAGNITTCGCHHICLFCQSQFRVQFFKLSEIIVLYLIDFPIGSFKFRFT